MRLKFMLICGLSVYMFFANQVVVAASRRDRCALPPTLREEIATQYPRARLVKLADLDAYNRKLFQKDHDGRCPGLVKVNFYGDGKPTWALVLMIGEGSMRKAELVVAHQLGKGWETRSLDTVDASDASEVPVVWRQGPGTYNDISKPKTIQATNPVIVHCGYEVWAKLYAWTGKEVEMIWISD